MLNKILLYAVYAVTIAGFVAMYFKLRPIVKRKYPAQKKLALTSDKRFIAAVNIAVQHGAVNSKLLARRLKLNKSDAEDLLALLQAKHIIAPANEQGISQVIN